MEESNVSINKINILNEDGTNSLNFNRHFKTTLKYPNNNSVYYGPNHGQYGLNENNELVKITATKRDL